MAKSSAVTVIAGILLVTSTSLLAAQQAPAAKRKPAAQKTSAQNVKIENLPETTAEAVLMKSQLELLQTRLLNLESRVDQWITKPSNVALETMSRVTAVITGVATIVFLGFGVLIYIITSMTGRRVETAHSELRALASEFREKYETMMDEHQEDLRELVEKYHVQLNELTKQRSELEEKAAKLATEVEAVEGQAADMKKEAEEKKSEDQNSKDEDDSQGADQ